MEQITKHEYLDVYRVADGVLLNVKKYKEEDTNWAYSNHYNDKMVFKKIKGLKNLYECILDVVGKYYSISVGDIIYGTNKISLITNATEYRYEIKTTGEMFSGDYKEVSNYLYVIIEVMDRYLNE